MQNKSFSFPLFKKYKYYILAFSFAIISLCSTAAFVPDKDSIDMFLERTIKSYKIPGLAVAIVNDEGAIYMSGYGELRQGGGITPNTPFLLGSTTKTFTALAVMRLAETGKIDLNSPVKKYLPEFRLASPEYENVITIRHLLNHTSGLSDAGMPFTSLGENSLEEELVLMQQCKPDGAPGVKYVYFNDNYRILGLVIEKVSGMKYGEFLDKEIFKPLGMTSTWAGSAGVKNIAPGYGSIFGFPLRRGQRYRAGALPSGYIVSTVSDIALLLTDELRAGNTESSVLDSNTVKMTWQPPENIKSNYGMGWMVFDTIGKTPFLAHGGSLENYESFFYINPELDLGFVFLMNQGGIMPMYGGFSTIRSGLIKIIDQEVPEYGIGSWPVFLVAIIFLLVTVLETFVTIRLKSWKTRTEQKRKWKRWAGLFSEFIFASFVLFWLFKGWIMFYSLLPEISFLMWIMGVLGFVRLFVKLWVIKKNPGILF